MINKCFSQEITVFHGRSTPEAGNLVGYGALIDFYKLAVPIPERLSLISKKNRRFNTNEWLVLTPRHQPKDSLYGQLVFALKYEGINLLFFKKLFEIVTEDELLEMVSNEPLGIYSRKIWFLYEWLTGKKLNIEDLDAGNYIVLLDEKIQFGSKAYLSSKRHRVRNNLPGERDFCPLIFRTEKLEKFLNENFAEKINAGLANLHGDILRRTAAFLLLKDSKASFNIEGENPTSTRATRWGKAIGQSGSRNFNRDEIIRLQQIVIENSRFIKMGIRDEGGFVGEHDRFNGEPIPDHISAKPTDLENLIAGLVATAEKLERDKFPAVLSASMIAFGFVFIHPLVDGNGRIHRYLIHHTLASMEFTPKGIIFPISASILKKIDGYRQVLENYSHSILDFIEWEETPSHNVKVLNETIDYYRYFDATRQTEFLYECVQDTVESIIPAEIKFLESFDEMKRWLDDNFQMPDKTVSLLIRFLEQNNGRFSKRAKEKEFNLTQIEATEIENAYKDIFGNAEESFPKNT